MEQPDLSKVQGIFLLPMSHSFAQGLVAELEKVVFQLGPLGRDFYEGLVTGIEQAANGEQGLLYDSGDKLSS